MLKVLAIALPTAGEHGREYGCDTATEKLRASLQAGLLPLEDLERLVSRLGFTFGALNA